MRALIVGGGQVGSELARRMSEEHHDVVIIEEDDEVIQDIEATLDVMVVRGNGTSVETLRRAGIEITDLMIAVTQIDEVNIVASMISKACGVPKTVARIRNPEFEDGLHVLDLNAMGIDVSINPERLTAHEIARNIKIPNVEDLAFFGDNRVMMLSFIAAANSDIVGQPIKDVDFPRASIIVAIVKPDGDVIIPMGQDIVAAGDKIYVIGQSDSLHRITRLFRSDRKHRLKVVIFGGGMIGFELAKILEENPKNNISVTLIEKNLRRCEDLATRLNRTLVVHGDASDTAVLEEEVRGADVSVALLGDDETNLLTTLLAKSHGVKRCMSEVMRPEYQMIFDQTGIDFAINPRISTVSKIVTLIRQGDIIALSLLENERAEVIELIVPPTASIVGQSLQNARLPRGIIVGTVIRDNEVFIPTGKTSILPNDRIVLFAKQGMEHHISRHFG